MNDSKEKKESSACQKPCKTCPWGIKSSTVYGPEARLEVDGGAFSTEQMLGQAVGPFWLPCHMGYNQDPDVHGKDDIIAKSDAIPQCAGAAIFRANIGVSVLLPAPLLRLEQDESVFATAADFYAYHKQVDGRDASFYTSVAKLNMLALRELKNQQNKNIKKLKP